jgi:NAD-dependent SIR2 family protein deacetylase
VSDPGEIVQVECLTCGHHFEDIAVAVDQHGGWCPRCDAPAGRILSPVCPLCGAAPLLVLGVYSQAFCPTEDCAVLTWNPREDAGQIGRGHIIDL